MTTAHAPTHRPGCPPDPRVEVTEYPNLTVVRCIDCGAQTPDAPAAQTGPLAGAVNIGTDGVTMRQIGDDQ